jgi:DNA-binding MarR family transcriptional regulator
VKLTEAQWRVLQHLDRRGADSGYMISGAVNLKPASVAGVCTGLMKRGLVSRPAFDLWELTPAGRRALEERK